jgi:two-component system, OmpR family, sensor histidine kinase BaeS
VKLRRVLPARAMAYFADRSRPRDTGGSGLGLAICYQLVDALGGSITVGSTVGVGATFSIRLPAWD